jgi:segregation and condensation protein A
MIKSAFKVKQGDFEGPFALLLELIEKDKLSINDISLSKVADEYLEYVRGLDNYPLDDIAGFVVVASTLMLIKSRSLLPGLKLTEEEEESIEELEKRLFLYKQIKKLSKNIKASFGKKRLFKREPFLEVEPQFIEPKGIEAGSLFEALKKLVESIPVKEIIPETVVRKVVSLEEKIKELINRIEEKIEISFSDFAKNKREKIEMIVSFLAVLELVKRGIVMVNQEEQFSNISIIKS